MINHSKRIFIYILIGFLSFSSISISYNRGVHAMEWVGGALAFEEALKWLMASIGVVAGADFVSDYWTKYGDDFEEYCIEQEITQQEVTQWQIKLCEGVLDKGSDVWSCFKDWLSSLVNSSGDSNIVNYGNFMDIVPSLLSNLGYYGDLSSFTNYDLYKDYSVYGALNASISGNKLVILFNSGNYTLERSGNQSRYVLKCDNINVNNTLVVDYNNYSIDISLVVPSNSITNNSITITDNIIASEYIVNSFGNRLKYFDINIDNNSDFNILDNVNIDNLDIISSTTDNVEDSEVAIPMPGQISSDNELSSDTYDEIIDQINEGTLSLEDGIEQIQSLLQVIVYDSTTDQVVPEPSGGPQDKDDKLEESKANEAFTLNGLEEVFPFCLPWDIYLFMSLLEAEPVAPNINWPFRNPVTKDDIIVAVDLSPFNGVAQVVRYGFDLLFIVGLAMVTRSLIGAGGGDG